MTTRTPDGLPLMFKTMTIDVTPGTDCISMPDWEAYYAPRLAYWKARAERAERKIEKRKRKKALRRGECP